MRRLRRTPLLVAAVAALVGLQLLWGGAVFGWIGRGVAPALAWTYQGSIGLRSWLGAVGGAASLAEENQTLRQRLEQLEVEAAAAAEAIRQRNELASLVSFATSTGYRLITARLLGAPAGGRPGLRLLDRGSADGLAVGQPVVARSGAMVGVVHEVWSAGSSVLLLDAPLSQLAAAPLGRPSTGGVLNGEEGLGLTLTKVVPTEAPVPGERIGTSGLQPGIPRGLLIGTVRQVWRGEGELFVNASVEPAVDARSVSEVGVIAAGP